MEARITHDQMNLWELFRLIYDDREIFPSDSQPKHFNSLHLNDNSGLFTENIDKLIKTQKKKNIFWNYLIYSDVRQKPTCIKAPSDDPDSIVRYILNICECNLKKILLITIDSANSHPDIYLRAALCVLEKDGHCVIKYSEMPQTAYMNLFSNSFEEFYIFNSEYLIGYSLKKKYNIKTIDKSTNIEYVEPIEVDRRLDAEDITQN